MSVYTQDSPGPWHTWYKRPENAKLPVLEAKRKYLKQQLLFEQQYASFVQAQQQFLAQSANQTEGGVTFNEVTGTNFVADPVFQSITANTQSIDVHFGMPVDVTGSPRITVTNNQEGGGSAATFVYTHVGFADGATNVLRFQHNHPAFEDNDGGAAANAVLVGSSLFDTITASPTTPVAGDYTTVAQVAQGAGGDAGNIVNISCSVSISDLQTVTDFTITADPQSAALDIDNTVTIAGSILGGGGSLVATIAQENLKGDVISLGSQLIDLNGGTITTAAGNTQTTDTIKRQGVAPNLAIVGSNTKTVVAS